MKHKISYSSGSKLYRAVFIFYFLKSSRNFNKSVYYFRCATDVHTTFCSQTKAASVFYHSDLNVLVILSTCEESIKKAAILSEMHFRSLRTKLLLRSRNEEAMKQLEAAKKQALQSPIYEQLTLPEDLVGLAIGAQGANIQAARRIPGILSVEVDEPACTFNILGEVCWLFDLN